MSLSSTYVFSNFEFLPDCSLVKLKSEGSDDVDLICYTSIYNGLRTQKAVREYSSYHSTVLPPKYKLFDNSLYNTIHEVKSEVAE